MRSCPYAHVPQQVEDLIAGDYQLHIVRAYSPEARNFYDVQDGFYLPFGSFKDVERPGPIPDQQEVRSPTTWEKEFAEVL